MQAETGDRRPRVLLLADDLNPEWPSLPVVGYKYARALARICDATVATHVRNRPNVEAAQPAMDVVYLDNEWIAAPMHRLATKLRGGDQVAWSTSMMMGYLPYLAFERAAWKHFGADLRAGRFDLVHRITPMTPTMPSWIARRLPVPFVLGPLNGNLDWPRAFAAEQARERERLRALRDLYRVLPFARSTYDRAAAVLCAFEHTRADLGRVEDARIVPFPEIGFDADLFHAGGAAPAGARDPQGRLRFLFAGRLVPYKLPELPVLAFARHPALRAHRLEFLGEGPERPRIEALIAKHELGDCVTLHGRADQAGVANWMRNCDAFVFPSIRELGAGVVIEAMASGMDSIVTDYGAPGALAADGRGVAVPMAPLDELADIFARAMLDAANNRAGMAARAHKARRFAMDGFTWQAKAVRTRAIYDAVLAGAPLHGLGY